MFHGHQDFPKQSCKAQYREGEGEVDRRRWEDNISDWTGLKLSETLRMTENREEWRETRYRQNIVKMEMDDLKNDRS